MSRDVQFHLIEGPDGQDGCFYVRFRNGRKWCVVSSENDGAMPPGWTYLKRRVDALGRELGVKVRLFRAKP